MRDQALLESQLDEILEVEFSFRNTALPAARIIDLDAASRDYVLEWVRRVASTNIEIAYQYACNASRALQELEPEVVEAWALQAMDIYDREGLRPALAVIRDLDGYMENARQRAVGAVLEQEEGVLLGFLHGLSGRRLRLSPGERLYTDTETLFLPLFLSRLDTPKENFLLYKLMITGLWAQTRYGTFRAPLQQTLSTHPEPERVLALFSALETLRLEVRIARELPGLYRELKRLRVVLKEPPLATEWQALRRWSGADFIDSTKALEKAVELSSQLTPFARFAYQGELLPESVESCMAARLEREKARFRVTLKLLQDELADDADATPKADTGMSRRFSKQAFPDRVIPEEMRTEILLDGKPLPLPQEVRNLMSSIILDLGEIPDEYLEPAGAGEYDSSLLRDEDEEEDDVWSGTYHEEGAHLYHEWDFQRLHYRKNWCAVREITIPSGSEGFVEATLEKYYGLVRQLRKTFEAMRDENRLLKRQTDGEDVDLDALVEALADARDGREMSDRLFTRMHRSERNIAVLFMVDMSGSTKGWINQAERESLVLLCEALETLGDRYAIYGFSSYTRKRCEIYHIKRFNEPYSKEIKARISGIQPKDYTRMGAAIRHLSKLLLALDARTRILITLSDGKPDDYDNYRGEFGIEDTRRALIEARRDGIHPYCITIDEQAREYLPHLYGPAAFTVVDEVRTLPLKVSDVYRRLTT